MSNNPLEEYKKLYSEYVSQLVELHYHHYNFIKYGASRDSGHMVRRLSREMIFLQKRMIDTALEAHQESLKTLRANSLKKNQAKVKKLKKKDIQL